MQLVRAVHRAASVYVICNVQRSSTLKFITSFFNVFLYVVPDRENNHQEQKQSNVHICRRLLQVGRFNLAVNYRQGSVQNQRKQKKE